VNPLARKSVGPETDRPHHSRLTELDQVNAKNAATSRMWTRGHRRASSKAQSAADAAPDGHRSRRSGAECSSIALNASGHVDQLNSTVGGLDKYHQVTDIDITFRRGNPVVSDDSKKLLDDLALA